MNIIIIGSGVSGSVLADLLSKRGHKITVLEKENAPGGMCRSYYKEGFVYEYGPHILANHNSSEETMKYIRSKIDTVDTQLTTASCVNGKLTYYPPSVESASVLGYGEQVKKEISNLPSNPDETNFETYLISKVGRTLYQLFFENFTKKFWGVEPKKLSAEWAKIRHLGESINSKKMFFNEKWCAYPKNDWGELFGNLLKNIDVIYDVEVIKVDFNKKSLFLKNGDIINYDFLISTMHIDTLFDFKSGKLGYAGYRIEPVILNKKCYIEYDDSPISMTYYPDKNVEYSRVTDYGTFQKKNIYPYNLKTMVTFEYPDHSIRLYPFSDKINNNLFKDYLTEISKQVSVFSFGRMGLYKYLTSDTTVEMAFRAIEYIENWEKMDMEQRLRAYQKIRGDWKN